MQNLGTLGGNYSEAYGVSANGSVVVGWAHDDAGYERAFRWENGVMQNLGTLPGGGNSWANAASANGAVVVGVAWNAAGQLRAVRWTASGGIQDLGTLGGSNWTWVSAVSADGSVMVGCAQNAAGQYRAVRWTASGIEDLNITYASLLTNGSALSVASAISPDGRYIVGWGYNAATGREEAFLLDTQECPSQNGDVDANGCVDDADLLAVLFNFGNSGSTLGREDTNCDGIVDDADLLTVLFNFGSGC
jgi:probable HAF family extracellular repeat protein